MFVGLVSRVLSEKEGGAEPEVALVCGVTTTEVLTTAARALP